MYTKTMYTGLGILLWLALIGVVAMVLALYGWGERGPRSRHPE